MIWCQRFGCKWVSFVHVCCTGKAFSLLWKIFLIVLHIVVITNKCTRTDAPHLTSGTDLLSTALELLAKTKPPERNSSWEKRGGMTTMELELMLYGSPWCTWSMIGCQYYPLGRVASSELYVLLWGYLNLLDIFMYFINIVCLHSCLLLISTI